MDNPSVIPAIATFLAAGLGWGYVLLLRRNFLRQKAARQRREREGSAAG